MNLTLILKMYIVGKHDLPGMARKTLQMTQKAVMARNRKFIASFPRLLRNRASISKKCAM
jgi:hypothetical protein